MRARSVLIMTPLRCGSLRGRRGTAGTSGTFWRWLATLLRGSAGWCPELDSVGGPPLSWPWMPPYRAVDRAEHDAALRQRGNLMVRFTEEAITARRVEPRATPGGQPHYSALAILRR